MSDVPAHRTAIMAKYGNEEPDSPPSIAAPIAPETDGPLSREASALLGGKWRSKASRMVDIQAISDFPEASMMYTGWFPTIEDAARSRAQLIEAANAAKIAIADVNGAAIVESQQPVPEVKQVVFGKKPAPLLLGSPGSNLMGFCVNPGVFEGIKTELRKAKAPSPAPAGSETNRPPSRNPQSQR